MEEGVIYHIVIRFIVKRISFWTIVYSFFNHFASVHHWILINRTVKMWLKYQSLSFNARAVTVILH